LGGGCFKIFKGLVSLVENELIRAIIFHIMGIGKANIPNNTNTFADILLLN